MKAQIRHCKSKLNVGRFQHLRTESSPKGFLVACRPASGRPISECPASPLWTVAISGRVDADSNNTLQEERGRSLDLSALLFFGLFVQIPGYSPNGFDLIEANAMEKKEEVFAEYLDDSLETNSVHINVRIAFGG